MGAKTKGSVGKRGKNNKADVETIQKLLNNHVKVGGYKKLKPDGISGKKTIGAIYKFQTNVAGFKKGDGRVDCGKNTFKALCKSPGAVAKESAKKSDKKGAGKPKKVSISYTVPIIAQPTDMSCWATAIAMMLGWKKQMSFAPKTIADELGYTKEFKSGGLHPEDTKVFKHWGLKWEAPMCYSVQGFADLLKSRGPVWIAGNSKSPHVRVVTGMSGDGTPNRTKLSINDPWGGKKYKKTFIQVMGKMEDLGGSADEVKLKAPIYVAHF